MFGQERYIDELGTVEERRMKVFVSVASESDCCEVSDASD